MLLYSLLCRDNHLCQHIQRKHPESRLSPKLKDASLPSGIFDPTAAAVANQDVDEPDDIGVSQPLETGPIVLRLSYSVGCCTLRLSILGANGRCLVVWGFALEGFERRSMEGLAPSRTS